MQVIALVTTHPGSEKGGTSDSCLYGLGIDENL